MRSLKIWIPFVIFLLVSPALRAQLQPPDDFLPHQLGETFTPHHLLVDYYEYIADNSDRVQLTQYGLTNEKRPLLLAIVSSPENLARLEAIRENHLRRAGLLEGTPDPDLEVAIVWLSFSVHGNEAAGSEASMGVLYDLANPDNEETSEWLENTIVLLDPSLNPDGYSRYTHWYRGVANRLANPHPGVREHREPWPGGRVNHYLFDLNRDWAWQTQVESQQRIPVYQSWLPHIHADLHEQYYDSPYYFAPAARPYHKYITDWQARFQDEIGRNHARYFDQNGWLYFTKEVFDLFYPSYGDTYPTFTGAIGMTYEQGGHSRGGRAIIAPNQDTLTLYDRVAHHRTTALSTVEVASDNADRLVDQFSRYFDRANNEPTGKYRSYIIKGSNAPARVKAFLKLLDKNGIRYGYSSGGGPLAGYEYSTGQTRRIALEENDIVISAYQPFSVLTQVLLDPTAELEDSLTYDITAWALPYAYGLDAYATTQRLPVDRSYEPTAYRQSWTSEASAYAYLTEWNAVSDATFLADLLQRDIVVRYATKPFAIEGKEYARGTLIITRADNRKREDLAGLISTLAQRHEKMITPVQSGYVDSGRDLGSDAMRLISRPKVAVLAGESTYSNEFGQVWHFFEQRLRYPLDIYDADRLSSLDLDEYDVLIMPEGRYQLSEKVLEGLAEWVSSGGRLIAIGDANRALADKPGFSLAAYESDEAKKAAEAKRDSSILENRYDDYGGAERRSISNSLPGAIFGVNMDTSHPLAFGLSENYFSLKTNTLFYPPLKNAWNVGIIGEDPLILGFVGAGTRSRVEDSVLYAVEEKGQGSVVYLIDNPLFRGFWENGLLLFSNAVFF